MGRGRKCHYKSCGHGEAVNKTHGRRCKFFPFPKDLIRTAQWLQLSGIDHLTPKRITAFNCFICSCHFPNGKENGPVEYIEECNFDGPEDQQAEVHQNVEAARKRTQIYATGSMESPPVKSRKVEELTPSSKVAIDALMSLTKVPEPAEGKVTSKNFTYSPRRQLWRLRGNSARDSARRTLHVMMESAETQEQETFSEACSDLGVAPLRSPSHSSFDLCDDNNNILVEKQKLIPNQYSSQQSLEGERTSCLLSQNYSPPPTASERSASLSIKSPQVNVNIQERSFRSIGIQCNMGFLCYNSCSRMAEKDFIFYTGVSQTVFELLYEYLGGDEVCNKLKYKWDAKTPKRDPFNWKLTAKDKLFLTLLWLRRGIPYRDLKVLFNISIYHASSIAFVWVRFMSLQFKKLDNLMFTSAAAQNLLKPQCYEKFPNLRVIIDSTEFKTQRPKHFQQQNNTFSSYKAANTIKFLVGISCFGGLSFLSDGFEGSISDRKLLVQSGLMDRLQPEDAIMADRGFDCEDLCNEKEVDLLIPAFLDKRTHFTARELLLNRAIAVSRIHVETFIGKIKQFRVVRYPIHNKMLPIASDLVRVCAYLVNFNLPFIKDDADKNID